MRLIVMYLTAASRVQQCYVLEIAIDGTGKRSSNASPSGGQRPKLAQLAFTAHSCVLKSSAPVKFSWTLPTGVLRLSAIAAAELWQYFLQN